MISKGDIQENIFVPRHEFSQSIGDLVIYIKEVKDELKSGQYKLEKEIGALKKEVRKEFIEVHSEIKGLRGEMNKKFTNIDNRFNSMENVMQLLTSNILDMRKDIKSIQTTLEKI
jgi:chromosome segregation ATPase